jgi:chromosome segregation ATPase
MLPTVSDLIKLNEQGRRILNGSLESLRDSLAGADAEEKADILAEMDLISSEIHLINNKLIHLRAAVVEVQPMSQELQEKLDVLAAALDEAILTQAWIDASLDIIQGLFDTASEIRSIAEDHT